MFRELEFSWRAALIVPLGILLVPLAASAFVWDQALLLIVPVAFLVGTLGSPRHLWVVWLGATVMMRAVYGLAVLAGFQDQPASDPGEGETIWTFALEAFVWMAMLAVLPMFLGRFARRHTGLEERWRIEHGAGG